MGGRRPPGRLPTCETGGSRPPFPHNHGPADYRFFAVDFFAVDFLAVVFFAGDLLAVDFFAVVFLRAVDFLAVDFLAEDFLAVDFLAAGMAHLLSCRLVGGSPRRAACVRETRRIGSDGAETDPPVPCTRWVMTPCA